MEEEEGDSDDGEALSSEENHAAPREHSYLGTSHPLYPESFLSSTSRNRLLEPRIFDLAILELEGVVFFPGTTLPLRLRNPQFRSYLRERLSNTSTAPPYIGIITRTIRLDQRRGSWMRQSIRRRTSPFSAEMLLQQSDSDEDNAERRPRQERSSRNEDSLVGRIGTLALVSYAHGEVEMGGAVDVVDEMLAPMQGQLIVTVLGISRFRILSRASTDESRRDNQAIGEMANFRIYNCEELPEEDFTLSSIPRALHRQPLPHPNSDRPPPSSDQAYFDRHDSYIRYLSSVTPLPYFVYKRYWPWRLVGLIREALDSRPSLKDLRSNLPSLENLSSLEGTSPLLDPVQFSFWMASNMSLKEDEKLEVLRMPCTVERLQYILERIERTERVEMIVCCKNCLLELSQASNMFTVGGAEGTTGAYVNEYGIVHQTVTLLSVDETQLLYTGQAETRESWFPGYSWTIANCRNCYSHLGWKFQLVHGTSSRRNLEDRPNEFWGLSGSSVTMASAQNDTNVPVVLPPRIFQLYVEEAGLNGDDPHEDNHANEMD